MTTNTERDDPGGEVPRWAATAGRTSLAQRLAARSARLFCSPRRPIIHVPRRSHEHEGKSPRW